MKLFAIQINAQENLDDNIHKAESFIAKAAQNSPHLVVLPEMFPFMGSEEMRQKYCDEMDTGLFQTFSEWAKKYRIYLVAGSHTEKITQNNTTKLFNTSVVYDPSGKRIAHYRKIHLFHLSDSQGNILYSESKIFSAGDSICQFQIPIDNKIWNIRLGICYDLRFPEYFRTQLQNTPTPDLILLPSAFTYETGAAHWETLLRARAVENQCFIVGCNQTGYHSSQTKRNFGHSMIFDPWGNSLGQKGEEEGIVGNTLNFDLISQLRNKLPALANRVI